MLFLFRKKYAKLNSARWCISHNDHENSQKIKRFETNKRGMLTDFKVLEQFKRIN